MKYKIKKTFRDIFSLTLILSILGGGVVFVLFIISLFAGGSIGANLSVMAAESVMPLFIRLASVAILSGLIWIYMDGKHSLSMKKED